MSTKTVHTFIERAAKERLEALQAAGEELKKPPQEASLYSDFRS